MKKQLVLLLMAGALSAGAHAQTKGGEGDTKAGAGANSANEVRDNAQGKSRATKSAERKEKRAAEAGAKTPTSGGDGDDKSIPANSPNMPGNPGAKK